MRKLRILGGAQSDLKGIFDYILVESGSIATAQQFINALRLKCRHLSGLPGQMGRPRPSIGPDIRSFAFRGYILLFRYTSSAFEVIRVLEGHRDIETQFSDPDV